MERQIEEAVERIRILQRRVTLLTRIADERRVKHLAALDEIKRLEERIDGLEREADAGRPPDPSRTISSLRRSLRFKDAVIEELREGGGGTGAGPGAGPGAGTDVVEL